jgi:hypothetical protein
MGGHTQKLSRWMINHKIPLAIRDRIPILCIDAKVAAFKVGSHWTVNEAFTIRNEETRKIYVTFVENS